MSRGISTSIAFVAVTVLLASSCADPDRPDRPDDPLRDHLESAYEATHTALKDRDSARYRSTLTAERRQEFDSLLAQGTDITFADFADLALMAFPDRPMEARRAIRRGDTAVLVLTSLRADTAPAVGDDARLMDVLVHQVKFLPSGDEWGVVGGHTRHIPGWMALDHYLASVEGAGAWRYPTSGEHVYPHPPREGGAGADITAVGVADGGDHLHLRLRHRSPLDSVPIRAPRLFIDTDDDPATGKGDAEGIRGDVRGWERRLGITRWPDPPGSRPPGSLSYSVTVHRPDRSAASSSTGPSTELPGGRTTVYFWEDLGWIRAEGEELLMRIPLTMLDPSPSDGFAFYAVDGPFEEEANGRRLSYPPAD